MTRRIDPTKAIAYLRVSTDEQHLGPEAQRAAIEVWAARKGVQVVSWHEDRDLGGAKGVDQRPGLAAALAALRAHGARWLVAAKRDRLARDVELAGFLDSKVRRLGAVIVTADGASDQQTTEGHLMTRIVDVFAEHERRIIRDRTKSALAVKRARGERVSRHPPYGWALCWELVDETGRVVREASQVEVMEAEARRAGAPVPLVIDGLFVRGRPVPDPDERAALAKLDEWAAEGWSYTKIAGALERAGHRSRSESGRWNKTTIARLVRRRENTT